MKIIRLTHNHQTLELTVNEALTLHKSLQEAMTAAGLSPAKIQETIAQPSSLQKFTKLQKKQLTDC